MLLLQGQLNSLKVVGAQLTNKTHFYCKKLNSYEHLQILWGQVPPVPPGSATYVLNFVCFLMLLNKVSFIELYQNNKMIAHILLTSCSYIIFIYTMNAEKFSLKYFQLCTTI